MQSIKPFINSLRFKLFATILFIIVPLITVLILNNYYAVRVVRNQVAQSNKNMLSLYMGQIDRNLDEVDKYLFNLSETNTDVLDISFPRTKNENVYTLAKLRLFNMLVRDVGYYPTIDLFFVYSKPNDDLMMTQNFGNSLEKRYAVKEEIHRMISEDSEIIDYSRWHIWKGEGEYSLFHIIKTGDVYVGAWMNSGKLMVPLNLIKLGESGAALIATDKLEPTSHIQLIRDKGIDLQFPPNSYSITGDKSNYLVMGEASSKGNFNLIALVPDSEILEQLPYLQRISSVISIIAGLFLLLFLFLMRRVFLLPIKRIIVAMRKLRDGNWDAGLEQYPTSTEFEIMNDTFDRMISEIHRLKIDVYEEQLNHQKAELRQLQLQINPHFFLNSLNIIYNLATVKDFALIQEMSKCLVIYFRYMFRSNSYFVSLKDELTHTTNYLRIQQLRFLERLSYRVEAPDDVLEAEVPPLIIQSMVENSIKHAVNMDEPIEIHVEVQTEEDGDAERIVIIIRDTGPGFSDEILRKLGEDEEWISKEGEQTGIWNIRRRLRLLYQNQATIQFYNESSHGAVVRITLPLEKNDGREMK